MDLFLSVHLQKQYLLISLLINLLILLKWTLLEKSLGSLLRSLVIKSLIDNISVERLGLRNGVVHKNNSAGDNLAMFTLLKTEMDLKMKGISFLLFFSLD